MTGLLTLLLLACAAPSPAPEPVLQAAPPRVAATRGALDGPRKLALLVGIGAYDRATEALDPDQRWRALDGPPHSVAAMQSVLKYHGFQADDVLVLQDEAATGEAIERAFRDHLGRAGPGDIALFYYTGHGQQIADDNGDEQDGKDEALVPWDSLGTRVHDRHLRDDRIEALLGALNTQEVVLIVDACNAGSITRGGDAGEPDIWMRGGGSVASGGSGYVLLSASAAARPAVELDPGRVPGLRQSMGAMTWLLTQELSRPGADQMTWRELAWRLRSQMPTLGQSQVPQVEGDLNKALFSGALMDRPRHHRARIREDGQNLRIDAGSLHGLDEGDVLAVYKTGPDAPAEPIATATVWDLDLDEAEARLDDGQKLFDAQADQGLEVRPLQDRLALYLPRLDLSQAPPELRGQLEQMARVKKLQLVEGPADQAPSDVLLRVVGVDAVLERGDGARVPIPTDCGRAMTDALRLDTPDLLDKLEQAILLDRLRNRVLSLDSADGLDIALEARAVEVDQDGVITSDRGPLSPGGAGAVARPGQVLEVIVQSNEDRDVFVSLIELRTDGGVQTQFPYQGLDIDGARLVAGEAMSLGVYRMDDAPGQMAWKLIATESYVDFQSLEHRVQCPADAVALRGGAGSPLTALLEDALGSDGAVTRGHRDVGAWGAEVYFLRIED